PNGVNVLFSSGDRFRVHPRFLGMNLGSYETDLVGVFCKMMARGMTVVDVGAHVGIYSLVASRRVGDNGKVIAIEPSPANAALLRRHLRLNQCTNVEVIEGAAGASAATISFVYRPDATDPAAFANSTAYDIGGVTATIPVVTLDESCGHVSPGLIKIDVEG